MRLLSYIECYAIAFNAVQKRPEMPFLDVFELFKPAENELVRVVNTDEPHHIVSQDVYNRIMGLKSRMNKRHKRILAMDLMCMWGADIKCRNMDLSYKRARSLYYDIVCNDRVLCEWLERKC